MGRRKPNLRECECGQTFDSVRGITSCHWCNRKRRDQERREACRQVAEAWYSQGCQLCGETRRPTLEAAHRVPRQSKQEQIPNLVYTGTMEALIGELKKCVCLCANCHKLVDAGWLEMP